MTSTKWALKRGDLLKHKLVTTEHVLKEKGDRVEELEALVEDLCDHLDVLEAANEALGEEIEYLSRLISVQRGVIEELQVKLGGEPP